MKLGMFSGNSRVFPGAVLDGGRVIDLSLFGYNCLETVLADESGLDKLRQRLSGPLAEESVYPLAELKPIAPLTKPSKIICIGKNYREHAREMNSDAPEEPVFFAKFATSIIGPNESIVLPRLSEQVDYEAELAVVIGRKGRFIPEREALSYVAGYTVFNDVSARDLQMRGGQWMKGKALDTFAPLGPYLVTADEVPDPHRLNVQLWLNNSLMQDSNTENLIFNIPALISFLSQLLTLEPGDIIATGTPPGVGVARKPSVFLQSGDKVRIRIEGVGELENGVVGPEGLYNIKG